MAYYSDLSAYKVNSLYFKENHNKDKVLNIGWLGDKGTFETGEVSDEFLFNLWEYYKCPVFKERKIYFNESLDGYWKFFSATTNVRTSNLGGAEIRILDSPNNVVYAAPDMIIHYIVNHHYLPPKAFVEAVMFGPKPNSKEFCKMICETYRGMVRLECSRTACPWCNSKYVRYAYREKKVHQTCSQISVVETDKIGNENNINYTYYQMCENCGQLSEYEI